MRIPKRYWESIIRKQDDLERRVKRLELLNLEEAENRISRLGDRKSGSEETYPTIKEITYKPIDVVQETHYYKES